MTTSTHGRSAIALAAVCLSASMFGLEISSVPAILPTLQRELGADFDQLQWIMNAYTIAVTSVLMATGTLADRYGRKRAFVAAIVAFGLASLLCGLARDASLLVAARALQGAAGGAMLIALIAVLSRQFDDPRQRASAFGWWGVVFGFGLGFGPLIGGAIASLWSYEWVFLIHAPVSAAALVLALVGVRESKDPLAGRLDLAGVIALSLAVLGLAFFLTEGQSLGFDSRIALGALVLSAAAGGAFVLAETHAAHPMFDFSVFRIRDFSGALIGSVAMNVSFWPFMIYLPIYYRSALGYDEVTAGSALLAYTLPTLIVPPVAERIALRLRPRLLIPGGLFVIGAGFFAMHIGMGANGAGWATVTPGALLAGVGLGLVNTPVTNTTTGAVSSDRAGMASGIDMSARMISLAINIAMMGIVLVGGVEAALAAAAPGAMDPAALWLLARRIAAGETSGLGTEAASPTSGTIRLALAQGFSLVTLYGGLGASALAAMSFLVFGGGARELCDAPVDEEREIC